jgi:hypothetical protein
VPRFSRGGSRCVSFAGGRSAAGLGYGKIKVGGFKTDTQHYLAFVYFHGVVASDKQGGNAHRNDSRRVDVHIIYIYEHDNTINPTDLDLKFWGASA